MISIHQKIPNSVAIAVSGGIDSMAVLDFLRRSREVVALHYNHATEYAPKAESLVREYCEKHSIPLIVGYLREEMPSGVSKEMWWREHRYSFFKEATDKTIITAHHLEDVVEGWVFSSMHGNPFLIPSQRDNFVRPFLTTEKNDFISWCENKGVPFIEDPSNKDTKYMRNYIRNVMMENVLHINPGIKKTIKKKILNKGN